ncbi:unnamed protein product, partial [Effrenium voratum]
MVFPSVEHSQGMTSVSSILRHYAVSSELWKAFTLEVGDPGEDLRLLAALPRNIVALGCEAASVGGQNMSAIQASQVGLVYRLARRQIHIMGGGDLQTWEDPNPWEDTGGDSTGKSTPAPTFGVAGKVIEERKLKMSAILDQGDDSEFMVGDPVQQVTWTQRYVEAMGGLPPEEEEPTLEQLAALDRRVRVNGLSPYADFGVFLPYGRKVLRNNKFRTWIPTGDGSFTCRELPGPQNFQQWTAAYRVYRSALIMLGLVNLSNLILYSNLIEKFTRMFPAAWHLIVKADDLARSEQWLRVRNRVKMLVSQGQPSPPGWTEESEWNFTIGAIIGDEKFWSEQIQQPAISWLAHGGRGVALTPAEKMVANHVVGGQAALEGDVAQVHRVRFSRPPQQELPEVRGQVTYGLKDRAHRLDMAEDAKAELEKYFKERVFTFVHHYSGEVDNLGKAVEEVAAEQGVRVNTIAVDRASGDLLETQPYGQHMALATWRTEKGWPGPVRSKSRPYGLESNASAQQREADEGTLHAARSVLMCRAVITSRAHLGKKNTAFATLENPPESDHPEHLSIWELAEVKEWLAGDEIKRVNFNTCGYQEDVKLGDRYWKMQSFAGNLKGLATLARLCNCGGQGHVPVVGKESTKAAAYPKALCRKYAELAINHFKWLGTMEWLGSKETKLAAELQELKSGVSQATSEAWVEGGRRYGMHGKPTEKDPPDEYWEQPQALEAAKGYGCAGGELNEGMVELWNGCLRKALGLKDGEKKPGNENLLYKSPVDVDLLEAWQKQGGDPEVHVMDWLRWGTPLGIAKDMPVCNIFPKHTDLEAKDEGIPEDQDIGDLPYTNYKSVLENAEDAEIEVGRFKEKGYIQELTQKEAAEKFGRGTVSRMGLIIKEVTQVGSDDQITTKKKRRLIVDLRRFLGNDKCVVPERIVLARPVDVVESARYMVDKGQRLAWDKEGDWDMEGVTVDVSDAFPHLPTHPDEYAHCLVPGLQEGILGLFVALQFGLKAAPLLWGRLAAMLGRLLQSMLDDRLAQSQIFFDDTHWIIQGTARVREEMIAVVLYTMAALGVKVSCKGRRGARVKWIGIHFTYALAEGKVYLSVPEEFLEEVMGILKDWGKRGRVGVTEVRKLAGKTSWMAGIVIRARWAVSSIYATLTGHLKDVQSGAEERRREHRRDSRLKDNLVPVSRMEVALQWLRKVVAYKEATPTTAWALRPLPAVVTITTDASPWGMGATLAINGHILRSVATKEDTERMQVPYGEAASQGAMEALAVWVALDHWRNQINGSKYNITLRSDSVVALAVTGKLASSTPGLNWIAAELTIILEVTGLERLEVKHIPGKINTEADYLSRMLASGWRHPAGSMELVHYNEAPPVEPWIPDEGWGLFETLVVLACIGTFVVVRGIWQLGTWYRYEAGKQWVEGLNSIHLARIMQEMMKSPTIQATQSNKVTEDVRPGDARVAGWQPIRNYVGMGKEFIRRYQQGDQQGGKQDGQDMGQKKQNKVFLLSVAQDRDFGINLDKDIIKGMGRNFMKGTFTRDRDVGMSLDGDITKGGGRNFMKGTFVKGMDRDVVKGMVRDVGKGTFSKDKQGGVRKRRGEALEESRVGKLTGRTMKVEGDGETRRARPGSFRKAKALLKGPLRKGLVEGLRRKFIAKSTRKAKDRKRAVVMELAGQAVGGRGEAIFPLKEDTVVTVAAALKEANYKSADTYLAELRQMQVEKAYPLEPWLLLTFTRCVRAVRRGRGPTSRAPEWKLEEAAEGKRVNFAVAEGPVLAKSCYLIAALWMLREAELANLVGKDVLVNSSKKAVTLSIRNSKTDQEGEGTRRTLGCCGERICAQVCPYKVVTEALENLGVLAERVNKEKSHIALAVDKQGKACSKRDTVEAWAKLAGKKVNGHSARRSGAMHHTRMGMDIKTVAYLGRWKSSVVYTYAEEALEEMPMNKVGGGAGKQPRMWLTKKDFTALKEKVEALEKERDREAEKKAQDVVEIKPKVIGNFSHAKGLVVKHKVKECSMTTPAWAWRTECGWQFYTGNYSILG